jgi:hypothetical protein
MIDALGGRKAVALLVVIIIAAVTVIMKGDIPANFKDLLVYGLGIFVGGNAVEHAADAVKVKAEAGANAVVAAEASAEDVSATYPPAEAPADMSAIETKLNTIAEASSVNQQALAAILERVQYLVDRIQGKG